MGNINTLMPPIINSVLDGISSDATQLEVPFMYSIYSGSDIPENAEVQIIIYDQKTGTSVVNTDYTSIDKDSNGNISFYNRSTGIILNKKIYFDSTASDAYSDAAQKRTAELEEKHWIYLYPNDFKECKGQTTFSNIAGKIYRIQIRLASGFCTDAEVKPSFQSNDESSINAQISLLSKYGYTFSSWSSTATFKIIGEPIYNVSGCLPSDPDESTNRDESSEKLISFSSSSQLSGSVGISFTSDTEKITNYSINLYCYTKDSNNENDKVVWGDPIETITNNYTDQYNSDNTITYNSSIVLSEYAKFNSEEKDGETVYTGLTQFKMIIEYNTTNNYKGSFIKVFQFTKTPFEIDDLPDIVSIDNYKDISYSTLEDGSEMPDILADAKIDNELENRISTNQTSFTSLAEEEEEGRFAFIFANNTDIEDCDYMMLKRTDSDSNFKDWVDLKVYSATENYSNARMYDLTIESGKIYLYGLQKITLNGSYAKIIQNYGEIRQQDIASRSQIKHMKIGKTKDEQQDCYIVREFNHVYLVGEGKKQLKLKYNTTVDNLAPTISEQKNDTAGSKYPFILRNGAQKYRSLSLSTDIDMEMDDQEMFMSLEELYGGTSNLQIFLDYNNKRYGKWTDEDIIQFGHIYVPQNRSMYMKRIFRDKVIEFFMDGKPKLFKSAMEGNMLVRLMDVSFSPNQETDRTTGTISATCVEMGESDSSSLLKYGLYSIDYDSAEGESGLFFLKDGTTELYQLRMMNGQLYYYPVLAGKANIIVKDEATSACYQLILSDTNNLAFYKMNTEPETISDAVLTDEKTGNNYILRLKNKQFYFEKV